jgi:hypothetical protein
MQPVEDVEVWILEGVNAGGCLPEDFSARKKESYDRSFYSLD